MHSQVYHNVHKIKALDPNLSEVTGFIPTGWGRTKRKLRITHTQQRFPYLY